MKVLVATSSGQGENVGDYAYCVEGELIWVTDVCDRDVRDPQRGCGCGRGFGGLTSHRATTTAEVADLELSLADLRLAVRTSLTDQGWLSSAMRPDIREAILGEVVDEIRGLAETLPVGTIVRRDLFDFHAYPPS